MTEVDKKTQPSVAKLIRQIAGSIPQTQVNNTDVAFRRMKNSGGASDWRHRYAKAMFSYSPDNGDELRLEKDDLIEVIGEEEEGWWRGKVLRPASNELSTRCDAEGVFPSNFVKLVENPVLELRSPPSSTDDKRRSSENDSNMLPEREMIQPKKIHGIGFGNIFAGENKIELRKAGAAVGEGKKIDIVNKDAATMNNKTLNGRKVLENLSKSHEYAKTMFPYEAENEDELTLREGDVIVIVSKTCEDPGWWKGEINGKEGVFPDNFAELMTPEEVDAWKKSFHSPPSVPVKPFKMVGSVQPVVVAEVVATPPVSATRVAAPERPPPPDQHSKPSVGKMTSSNVSTTPPQVAVASEPTANVAKDTVLPLGTASVTETEKVEAIKPGTPKKSYQSPLSALGNAIIKPKQSSGVASDEKIPKIVEDTTKLEKDAVAPMDSERLTHPTALRPRNPNKRPPSTAFLKDATLPNVTYPMSDSVDSVQSSRLSTSTCAPTKDAAEKGFVSRPEFELLKMDFEKFKQDSLQRMQQLEQMLASKIDK